MVAILRNFDQTVVYPEDGEIDSVPAFQAVVAQFGGDQSDYGVVVPPPAPDMVAIVSAKIQAAMSFGKRIIIEYATQNVLAGKTTEQITAIVIKLAPLQDLISAGSLYSALAFLSTVTPDDNISQSDIDTFTAKIKTYLGIS